MMMDVWKGLLDPRDHLFQAVARMEVGEDERQLAAHPPAIAIHHREIRADMGCQIDFIDDQQVRARDPRPALARDLVSCGHVDDIDDAVDQFGTEGGGQIVPSAFDEHQVDIGMEPEQIIERGLIVGGIFANGRVGTAAGFHSQNAVLWQCAPFRQKLRVFLRENIIRHDGQAEAVSQLQTERLNQRRLARSDRPPDPDDRNALRARIG